MIRNVTDLGAFRRFLRLCAGRVGQLLDLSGIGGDVGVTHNTVRDWISVLEAGFISFRLEPYYKNFSKRVIKRPKLYFYDTGLLCRLLDIRSVADLATHPFRGNIFENWCVLEAMKARFNSGQLPRLFFWRDQSTEIDIVMETGAGKISAFECKSGATPVAEFIEPALKFRAIAKGVEVQPGVIHGGDESQKRTHGAFHSWKDFALLQTLGK